MTTAQLDHFPFPFPADLDPDTVPCRAVGPDDTANPWLSERVVERRQAARLCNGCSIVSTCNRWMLQVVPTFGVFAGVDTSLSLESPLVPAA